MDQGFLRPLKLELKGSETKTSKGFLSICKWAYASKSYKNYWCSVRGMLANFTVDIRDIRMLLMNYGKIPDTDHYKKSFKIILLKLNFVTSM